MLTKNSQFSGSKHLVILCAWWTCYCPLNEIIAHLRAKKVTRIIGIKKWMNAQSFIQWLTDIVSILYFSNSS